MAQVFVFGDSIVWGCWDSEGGWPERLRASLVRRTRSDPTFYTELYTLGVTGDTVADVHARMRDEVVVRRDDDERAIGVLAAGLNDAQILYDDQEPCVLEQTFRNRLDDLYSDASGLFDDVLVVGLTPVDEEQVSPIPWRKDRSYTEQRRERFDAVIEEKADAYGLRYIDPLGGTSVSSFRRLLEDGVHPSEDGHVIVLQQVLPHVRRLVA